MRIVPALIIALGLLLASLIVVFVPRFLPGAEGGASAGGLGVDSQARIEIELLRGEITAARDAVAELTDRLGALESQVAAIPLSPVQPQADGGYALAPRTGPNQLADSYAQVVQVADRRNLNIGLTVPNPEFLVTHLGMPREDLNDDCQPMTNPALAALVETRTVGPVTVQMLTPALDSLERVFARIEAVDPDLYARMATAGALCVRLIRGSSTSISTHSFGLALDLNIDGFTDTLGDGLTQVGLTILADFFNAEGWIWGAAYGREDSMHFEVSQEKVLEWIDEGLLPRASANP